MLLAKDKNGRIGRQLPKPGLKAQVAQSQEADRRGNLYLSQSQIEDDQAYHQAEEAKARAFSQAKKVANQIRQRAEKLKAEERARNVELLQQSAKFDPINAKLKRYFAKQNKKSQSSKVIESVADFSSSGANPEIVEENGQLRPIEWRADFRQHLIVGSPLTRDGVYGPAVTDYDRFVNGIDVNETNVVAGGTMLGRYDGEIAPAGMGYQHINRRKRGAMAGSMGFDWSWDSFTNAVSDTLSQTVDKTVDSLPAQLSKELQEQLWGSGGTATVTQPGQITVQRPVAGTTTTIAQNMGVPPWALYAFGGLFALGILFIGYKAVKS